MLCSVGVLARAVTDGRRALLSVHVIRNLVTADDNIVDDIRPLLLVVTRVCLLVLLQLPLELLLLSLFLVEGYLCIYLLDDAVTYLVTSEDGYEVLDADLDVIIAATAFARRSD